MQILSFQVGTFSTRVIYRNCLIMNPMATSVRNFQWMLKKVKHFVENRASRVVSQIRNLNCKMNLIFFIIWFFLYVRGKSAIYSISVANILTCSVFDVYQSNTRPLSKLVLNTNQFRYSGYSLRQIWLTMFLSLLLCIRFVH